MTSVIELTTGETNKCGRMTEKRKRKWLWKKMMWEEREQVL